MNRKTKNFLNSLRCPICQSQIDMHRTYASYGCVLNHNHYSFLLKVDNRLSRTYDVADPVMGCENVNVYDMNELKLYDIVQNYIFNTTEVFIHNIDKECRVIDDYKDKYIKFDVFLFDFQKFDRDKAINRIKTLVYFI